MDVMRLFNSLAASYHQQSIIIIPSSLRLLYHLTPNLHTEESSRPFSSLISTQN